MLMGDGLRNFFHTRWATLSSQPAMRFSKILTATQQRWAYLIGQTTVRHILTLLTGTLVSQVAVFGLSIIAKRYFFTPEDYGQFGYFASICGIVITIAAMRYDMTIMLPSADNDARQVKRLATRSIIISAVLATLVLALLYPQISAHYGTLIAQALLLGGVYIFFSAELANLQFWFNRKSNYKLIAFNRAQFAITTVVFQMGLALLGLAGMWGLVLGLLGAQVTSYLNLQAHAGELRKPLPASTPSMWQLAKRYRKMPLLGGPNALVDSLRLNGIGILVGGESMASLGAYQTAWGMLEVPIGLINGAIGQVYFQKMAALRPGELLPLVKSTTWKVIRLGLVPFIILYLISPWLFAFVFGAKWADTGYYARALTPWLFMQLISSPISNIFVVTERQQYLLAFAIVFAAVPLGELYFLDWDLLSKIYLVGASMGGLLVVMVVMAFWAAAAWDREGIKS